jgi:hypothetical protein
MEDRQHERRKVACTIEITKGARPDRAITEIGPVASMLCCPELPDGPGGVASSEVLQPAAFRLSRILAVLSSTILSSVSAKTCSYSAG